MRLLPLVFISGASGLIFEVLWIRAMGRSFGTAAPALATVVAAFMAGLAIGSALFGPRADRHAAPLRLYRQLELGIGLLGLLISLLLLRGSALIEQLSTAIAGPAELPLRALVCTLLVLLPTTLMGGTLPVLSRALNRAGATGRTLSMLYAVNTAGAVCGALLPDLLLVPNLGLTATAGVAALGNLFVALAMGGMQEEPAPAITSAAGTGVAPRAALGLAALSGFASMGLQVLWSRTIEHWAASQITSFSFLLAVFLAALASGAALIRRWADVHPLRRAATLLAWAGPAALLPLIFAASWRGWLGGWLAEPGVRRPELSTRLLDGLLNAAWLEIPACLLFGAAFPCVIAAAIRADQTGRGVGRLLTLNTVACVLGSVLTGFVILPALGQQTSYLLFAGVLSLSVLASPSLLARGAPVFVAVVAMFLPGDHLKRVDFFGQDGEVRSMREGPTTTAAVVEHRWFGEPAWLELRTPGTSMSDTRLSARRYMGVMGHVGLLFAEKKERALLICYGVGNTARSLLSHPDLQHLDVVDIAAEVIEQSRGFASVHGGDPLDDPRAEVILDDGRHHLVVTDRRYDLITSEPPPPTAAGVVNLYSREYYALARKKLAPGGVLTQWLPWFQLAPEETLAIISAFVAEFPHTALYYGYGRQWILVGSDAPLRIDPAEWLGAPISADLDRIGVDSPVDLIAGFLATDAMLRAGVQDVPPLSDDLPSIQYPVAAIRTPTWPQAVGLDPYRVREVLPPDVDPALIDALRPYVESTRRVLELLELSGVEPSEWKELVVGTALRAALAPRRDPDSVLALFSLGDDRVKAARAATLAGDPPEDALLTLARDAFYRGAWVEAGQWLERTQTRDARYYLLRGGIDRALGDSAAAARAFISAAEMSRFADFQTAVRVLADNAAQPWPPEGGPLARP